MEQRTNTLYKIGLILGMAMTFLSSCERKISDEAVLPSFPTTAEVFTDDFIGMGANFYFPFADAKPDVFSVDQSEGFESNASIRIDVPNASDPTGNYAGAIFRTEGAGRDLSQYDALTFYVKASQGVSLGEVGFGLDYLGDVHRVAISGVNVGTNWTRVIVPIPDPDKLTKQRGVFWFAAGTQGTNGAGYTLWFDEIKFEKTGLVGVPQSKMLNGETTTVQTFVGSTVAISGLSQVYNLATGQDQTISLAPAYYDFSSSDTSVAKVDAEGNVLIVGAGTAEITGAIQGRKVDGKLILESKGDLPAAPSPIHPAANVKSIFSDAYVNAVASNFMPGFGGSTTQTTFLNTSSGQVVQYASNNFTGIIFDAPVDGSTMTHLHIDAYVESASTNIGIQIRDIGANQTIETNIFTGFPEGDDKDYRLNLTGFQAGQWKSFDIPLTGDIASQKNNLGAIIITDGPDFILDNIYFYKN